MAVRRVDHLVVHEMNWSVMVVRWHCEVDHSCEVGQFLERMVYLVVEDVGDDVSKSPWDPPRVCGVFHQCAMMAHVVGRCDVNHVGDLVDTFGVVEK